MNKEQSAKRAEQLKDQLGQYDYEYYTLDKPSVDDAVYDSLRNELKKIESDFPELITSDSPTQRVVGEISEGFKTVQHKHRMLSLNDVFDESDIDAWLIRVTKLLPQSQKLTFFGDVKKDGLACSLIYQDGVFVQAVTRGDGSQGEDVTSNVKTIFSVPLRLRRTNQTEGLLKGRTEVRGEIVMYKDDFVKLNKQREDEGETLYANPRNTAAGTIRQLDSNLVAKRKLYFLGYDIIPASPDLISSHTQTYKLLKELGFSGSEYSKNMETVDEVHKYISHWKAKRDDLPYQIDGLVIKVDDRKVYSELGIVGKTPRGAIAYKYPAEQSTTIVKDIFISIGRTGSATPVAILKPVQVAGSTVQMATLHNESEIKRKDIRVGDTVVIQKAGDIIPEVVEPILKLRTKAQKPFMMPTKCPECETTLVKVKKEDVAWRCPNKSCPARTQRHIEHYASKTALDIEGLGEKNVELLLNSKLISDQADIYNLTADQLLKLERFADISANKLIAAINEKKNPELSKFIFGLGIRHVGIQTAIDLANKFSSLENLSRATSEELSKVDGIGEVVADSLVAWFTDAENIELLKKFKDYGVSPADTIKVEGKLEGVKFAITGSLTNIARTVAADRIRQNGGVFQSSLGKDTDYLVVGENVGAGKLTKAAKFGTKQITEEEFFKLIDS